jgi:hypothetical protein
MNLAHALALCVLLAEKDTRRFDRAAVRWQGRYVLETQGVLLGESAAGRQHAGARGRLLGVLGLVEIEILGRGNP